MTLDGIIDVIRRELQRQKKANKVSLVLSDIPDNYTVVGVIDIHALAEALMRHHDER